MGSWKAVPAKTLCRLFAISNIFIGILSILYWTYLKSISTNIGGSASPEQMVQYINDTNVRKYCGDEYLENISPRAIQEMIDYSIKFYMLACVIFGAKGLVQFFITCCRPHVTRRLCFLLLFIDLFGTSLMFYGLCQFRDPQLCILEYSDLLYQANQQTRMTLLTFILAGMLKPPEWTALICFILEQNRLIAKGETRSKGVRRSEAFRTPMVSRANSYVGRMYEKVNGTESFDVEQINSDEDEDDEGMQFFKRDDKIKFIEIDLNESENNNESNQNCGVGDVETFQN